MKSSYKSKYDPGRLSPLSFCLILITGTSGVAISTHAHAASSVSGSNAKVAHARTGANTARHSGNAAPVSRPATRTAGQNAAKHLKAGSETVSVSGVRNAFHFSAAQRSPDSDTHITADRLRQQGVVSVLDLQNLAPNVTIQRENGGATVNFYIRGIGMADLTQNNTQSVMTYVDDVVYPMASMMSGQMFDVAGVDIKAGPVGTEHGQADTGGEINIRTNDPTSTWHAGITEDIASYARSKTDFYISGPIAHNLSFRIAGQTLQGGGWQYNPTNGAHLGDANEGALRAKLKWTPDEKTEVKLTGHWVQDNSELVNGTSAVNSLATRPVNVVSLGGTASPAGSYVLPYGQTEWSMNPAFAKIVGRSASMKPSEHNTLWGANLYFGRDLGFAKLETQSAYIAERRGEYTDADASAWNTGDAYRNVNANSFSQEVKLHSLNINDRFQWTVGMHYNRYQSYQQMWFDFSQYTPTRGYLSETAFHDNQQTFAQYAHLSYRLPHNITIFGGINHEADDRQLNNLTTTHYAGPYTCAGKGLCQAVTDVEAFTPSGSASNQFSGVLGIQYQITPHLQTYFKVSKGFKPGGFTANNTVVQAQLEPMKPETVLAYEAGFKADPIPNVMRLNAAAFYYDYHDQQILTSFVVPSYGPLGRFTNVPKSEIWGIEFTLELHPFKHIFITENFGYERGVYQDFQSVNSAAVNKYYAATGIWQPIYTSYSNTDSGIPKMTTNGTADYRFNPVRSHELEIGVDWQYRDTQALIPGGFGNYGYHLPAYFLLGAHMTFRPVNRRWSVTVYGTNLANRQYYVSGGAATVSEFWIPGTPRFIGGRFGVDF
ncbi:TonB-dependent receptor plug domain-containing protein [Acetobacter musti]|uniref:TonB-dependent receptor plug domain-containing protein n=1 Tax=Acetobacter musti TaxID=864732 RepID=A0ABX0JS53_9PROT|nr:TonB-dependent receptor [Acetobacter musti]NHN86296.1 TonB-dependent receptor plug domain-containing protein [Acetobacter musti]